MPISDIDAVIAAATKVKRLQEELKKAMEELHRVSQGNQKAQVTNRKPKTLALPIKKANEAGNALADRIRKAMKDGKERSPADLAKSLGEDQRRVLDSMKRMANKKRGTPKLKRVRTGFYAITPAGKKG